MLEERNIPFDFFEVSFDSDCKRYHIYVPKFNPEGMVISVLQGEETYGEQDDLLEIMGLTTKEEENYEGVVGWLTAENVFERIKKYFDENRES